MIRTIYDLSIEIDDKAYSVLMSKTTKAQLSEIDKISKKHDENQAVKVPLENKINELLEEFNINKVILTHGDEDEKKAVMFEQKEFISKISKLRTEVELLNDKALDTSKTVEAIYKKRFDLQISGDDKAALKKEIEAKNISYYEVFEALEMLKKAAEKKK